MKSVQSAERVSQQDASDNFVFQRSQLAYYKAAEIVSGDVLEIGTGSGYGVSIISPKAKTFLTIDKFDCGLDLSQYTNVEFRQMTVPPFCDIPSGSFDFVITFQVIEHIKKDFDFLSEINRVLRPGGKLIISTPNKQMSLTRNPWHVREYTVDEFKNLLSCNFSEITPLGVYGNRSIIEYYKKNKESVKRFARLDIFRFHKWLPNCLLRIPYDILNRINRRNLLKKNAELTSQIKMDDYFLADADEFSFDLFFIAEK